MYFIVGFIVLAILLWIDPIETNKDTDFWGLIFGLALAWFFWPIVSLVGISTISRKRRAAKKAENAQNS